MAWRFRKSKNFGPFRATVSNKVFSTSVVAKGLRVGVNSKGRTYNTFGRRFRTTKSVGPFRATFSRGGVGTSFGFLGFRFGTTAGGRRFWSFGIPGTGLYYIKYY